MDPKTVFFLSSMIHGLIAGVLFVTWRMNRDIPGTFDWALAALFIGIGTWLLAFANSPLSFGAGIASKMALIYGLYRLWRGTRLFYARTTPQPFAVAAGALGTVALLTVASLSVEAPYSAQLLISSTFAVVFFVLLAAEFYRSEGDGERTFAASATSVVYFVYGAVTLYRAFVTVHDYPVFGPDRTIDLVQFVGSVLLTTYVGFVLVLLTTDRLHRTLRKQATIDPLTGALNRRAFHKVQESHLSKAQRDALSVAVSTIDIDHFKAFNDSHGHDAGDAVLKETVRRITDTVRGQDIVARFGGEEFLVLHPETSLDNARNIAERVRGAIADHPFEHKGHSLPVTVSIGVAAAVPPPSIEVLAKAADEALYEAKRAGRNRVVATVAPTPAPSLDPPLAPAPA